MASPSSSDPDLPPGTAAGRGDGPSPAGGGETTMEAAAYAPAPEPTSLEVELAGRRTVFDVAAQGDLVVGRAPDVTLTVEDERVSRRHLLVTARDGVLWARDLGSKNGTLVNGRRLEGERRLRGGDELEVGPARLRVGGGDRTRRLLDEGDLMDRLDEEIERAGTHGRPLGVVGLSMVAPPRVVDDAIGRLMGRLQAGDSAGEYAPGRLLVVLPERRLEQAEGLAREWEEAVRPLVGAVTVRAASLPESAADADELVALALPALRAGRPATATRSVVVEDPLMRRVYETARKVARSQATVLISGESGAGKELVAAEIHAASPRGSGPFVRINCAALTESLIESELFGHERAAFTGADRRRVGRIESADGGTVFLDEIGELPLLMQSKLLHVLEDRQVVRVGGNEAYAVDVRYVAATNRNLEKEIAAGRFREDLYYRLTAFTIEVPPLRQRPLDLVALAEHFIAEAAPETGRRPPRMGSAFRAALEAYPWPGNVRELKNVIQRAVVLADGDELTARQLPDRLRTGVAPLVPLPSPPSSASVTVSAGPIRQQVDQLERQTIEAALAATDGNRTHAARKLGISRRALIYKLHRLGLSRKTDD